MAKMEVVLMVSSVEFQEANTEKVSCSRDGTRWGSVQAFSFLARAGTHRIGQTVSVSFEVSDGSTVQR